MTFCYRDTVNHHFIFFRQSTDNYSGFTLIFARDYSHLIAFFNVHSHTRYTTSGAKEAIECQPRSVSSRGTGPKTRFPFGPISLPCFSIMTTAFSSKRMYEPSLRAKGFF